MLVPAEIVIGYSDVKIGEKFWWWGERWNKEWGQCEKISHVYFKSMYAPSEKRKVNPNYKCIVHR